MDTIIAELLPKSDRRASRGVRIGRLVGAEGNAPIVDYDDNPHGPIEARSIVAVAQGDRGRDVLMLFERGNAKRPVIIGFLLDRPAANDDTAPGRAESASDADVAAATVVEGRRVKDVRVDGERIVFEAKKEILLQCGEGSILMRADGKVIIKGINVTTRARALNKVKGAAVKIN